MSLDLGKVVATCGVGEFLAGDPEFHKEILFCLGRHAEGDWGNLCDEDKKTNEDALKYGNRILSSYTTSHGNIWIITEADRSATTILFPSEY